VTCAEAAAHMPTLVGVAFVLGACYQALYHHTGVGVNGWTPPWGGESGGDCGRLPV